MTDIQINIEQKKFPAAGEAGGLQVISNLKLSLKSGAFVCLVGPSGCGKTTLLNLVAGLDQDFEGSIQLGKQHTPPGIGYIFQNPRLLPWRTVRENIELALRPGQSSDIIDSLLAEMGLTPMANVYPERLSLGMSRRVSIIRAFAIDPDLLLMDEPLVSLDPPTARQVRRLLLKLWDLRPHTVLFVTHDLREAIAMADRLIFLSHHPMSIITEVEIPIPREERQKEDVIESFRQKLFSEYPLIQNLL